MSLFPGELLRKLWKKHHYRPHISPHEFLQSVVIESKGRFQFTERGNAGEFLTWFLNSLDKVMKKYEKNKESSFVRSIFEGNPFKVAKLIKIDAFQGKLKLLHEEFPIPNCQKRKRKSCFNCPNTNSRVFLKDRSLCFCCLICPQSLFLSTRTSKSPFLKY